MTHMDDTYGFNKCVWDTVYKQRQRSHIFGINILVTLLPTSYIDNNKS